MWCWLVENKEVLQALGPFAIATAAFLAAGISWLYNHRIHKVASKEFNLRLLEKRYPVFEVIRSGYLAILDPSTSEGIRQGISRLYAHMADAKLLFEGEEIAAKLEECMKFMRDAMFVRLKMEQHLEDIPRSPESNRRVEELRDEWLSITASVDKQIDALEMAFHPYLKFSDKLPH